MLTLLSFAATVTLTRLILYLTGYPQLGNVELHVAHVLWGGMLLFVASLLPLLFANRWALTGSAALSGIGIGLFIDEVGKFITQTHNYFYPATAPIIYTFFLLTLLLYVQVRRAPRSDVRAHLYHALDALEEVLDHDLTPQERQELLARLRYAAARADQSDLAHLAQHLLTFLSDEPLHLAPDTPGPLRRLRAWGEQTERRWLGRRRLKAIVMLGLAGLGVLAVVNLGSLLLSVRSAAALERTLRQLVEAGRVASASGLAWFSARVALEGTVGALLLLAAVLLLVRREHFGLRLGLLGLLLSLAAVDLLLFYFEQFSTIGWAAVQFTTLLALLHYQRTYALPSVEALRRFAEAKEH